MFENKISLRNAVLRGLVTLSLQKNYLIVKATAPKKNNDFIVSSIYRGGGKSREQQLLIGLKKYLEPINISMQEPIEGLSSPDLFAA